MTTQSEGYDYQAQLNYQLHTHDDRCHKCGKTRNKDKKNHCKCDENSRYE